MIDNKQNSGTENTESAAGNKTTSGGGSAASTQQAKEGSSAPNNMGGNKQAGSTGNPASQTPSSSQGGADTAKDTFNKAKETTGQMATEAVGQVKEKAASLIDEQKTNLASGINSVADSIRQIGENLGGDGKDNQIAALAGKYGDNLAGQVEKFSSYIEDKDLKELARDVEQFARRNPALFIGGAFALGILAARFLKSSSSGQTSGRRSQNSDAKHSLTSSVSSAINKAVQPS